MHTAVSKTPVTFGRLARAAAALGLVWAVTGCTSAQKQGDSPSYLAIESLLAAPGGANDTTFQNTLQSDVRTFGTTFSDPFIVSMRLGLKDPTFQVSPTNFVTVNSYRVRLLDANGAQVGQTFDGSATFAVSDVTTSQQMTLIPAQAKSQSPLKDLANTAQTLPLQAEVTFTGADQAGHAVSVTGRILTNFGDWPDPGSDDHAGQAAFTASGLKANLPGMFDASTSTAAPGRTIAKYTWDFGDGTSPLVNTLPISQHTFGSSGSYLVTLTITDSAGVQYAVQKMVTVVP
jgi:hypothetical protein